MSCINRIFIIFFMKPMHYINFWYQCCWYYSGHRMRTDSELSDELFTKYLVNTEVISSKRLRKAQNIYANRYPDTSRCFVGFLKLFFNWKGSIIKLIYKELFVYVVLFMFISCVYRFLLVNDDTAREYFEIMCVFCGR